MRNAVLCVLSCVVFCAGCSLPGSKCEMGWEYRVFKPAIVKGETSVLVQGKAGEQEAQALGGAAGPIQQGQFLQGPKGVVPVAPFFMQRQAVDCPSPCPPVAQQQLLTYDQWCSQQQQRQALPMPKAQ